MTLLSLVLALCPCLVAAPVEDDCCESPGTSMAGVCCEGDGGSGTTAPATTVLLAAPDFVAVPAFAGVLPSSVSARVPLIPTRPAVARAVLRI